MDVCRDAAVVDIHVVVNAGPFLEVRARAGRLRPRSVRAALVAPVLDRDAGAVRADGARLGVLRRAVRDAVPAARYDQVFVPEFGGAMENYGCVTWSDAASSQPADRDRARARHGAAARDGAHVVRQHRHDALVGRPVAQRGVRRVRLQLGGGSGTEFTDMWAASPGPRASWAAYLADQGPATHPIRQRVPDVETAARIFDDITYPKGASVLQQLMAYVGEDAFVAGMRTYFAPTPGGTRPCRT